MLNLSLDIHKTKALLIGNSDYTFLPKIEPAIDNINDIFDLLTNPEKIGLPEKNINRVINKSTQEIFETILDFFDNDENLDTETLIFYYAGHGFRETTTKELFLTGINTKHNSIRISGIPYNEIKFKLENNFIQKRIVLIDACHSGLATMNVQDGVYTETELDIKGTYVLTSSTGSEKSYFDKNARNTFFTKELISIIDNGLPINRPYLSLDDIFSSLQKSLKHSTPQRKTNMNSSDFFICKNTKYDIYSELEKNADILFEQADFENEAV